MERHFHEELRTLTDRLTAMGALVESRVRDAMTALLQRQADLAVEVATGDMAVNELELEVDDLCFKVLALQTPVASDLRLVRSIIKVNTDLERVGDQAVNIAQAVIDLLVVASAQTGVRRGAPRGNRRGHAPRQPEGVRGTGCRPGAGRAWTR